MFSGKVKKSFLCKLSQKIYRPGQSYENEKEDRLVELAEYGLVDYEKPKKEEPKSDENEGKSKPKRAKAKRKPAGE